MGERYLVDPMAAFYAAVTAVENGEIGEVEIEFRAISESEEELVMSISVRREIRHFVTQPCVRSDVDD